VIIATIAQETSTIGVSSVEVNSTSNNQKLRAALTDVTRRLPG